MPVIDSNVVDTDITYPAPPSSPNQLLMNNSVNSILGSKDANTPDSGVFFRHISHIPKF